MAHIFYFYFYFLPPHTVPDASCPMRRSDIESTAVMEYTAVIESTAVIE